MITERSCDFTTSNVVDFARSRGGGGALRPGILANSTTRDAQAAESGDVQLVHFSD